MMLRLYRNGLGWLWLWLCFSLVGCASSGSTNRLPMYQVDVVQGNVVTREQLRQLRVGMPKEAVRTILGSPLLASIFHQDRWEYALSVERQGDVVQKRQLTIFFKNETLARYEAEELPSEADFVASLSPKRDNKVAPSLVATPEQLAQFEQTHAKLIASASTPTPTPAQSPTSTNALPSSSKPSYPELSNFDN